MSLRTVADDTPRLWRSTNVLEPIGSLVATKSATMARNTSKRRSSALAIGSTSLIASSLRSGRAPIAMSGVWRRPPPRSRLACRACIRRAWAAIRGRRGSAADDLQGRARRQAVPGSRAVVQGVVADTAPADPARRTGHHHNGAGAGPPAVGGLHLLWRPFPARGAVEGHHLPRGRPASRGARRAAEPDRVACPGV